jgi:glycosyltransferase involved in cell wall biosynthesis
MKNGSPTKVLHVIARMNIGGPAILVGDLMRNIDETKFEQALVTGYCDLNERDYLDEVATDIRAVRILGFGRSISVFSDLKAFVRLIREIKKFQPEIVHTHTAKAGVLGRLASIVAKPTAKRVHTYHGHLLTGYFDKSKTGLLIVVEKILGSFSHSLIAIGSNVKRDLLEAGIGTESKFHVILPGLQDLSVLPKTRARLELGLDTEKLYLVYVGRITRIKRPDRLIEIAAQLKREFPNVQLLVVGGGDLFDSIQRTAETQELPMTLYGWRNDIERILSAADIALLCSDNEGVPLTLIQSAQAGLPIVSSDVGSVSDIVKDGVTGRLVKPNSAELFRGLKELIENKSLRLSFGAAGKLMAEKKFLSRHMICAHEELYSELLVQ